MLRGTVRDANTGAALDGAFITLSQADGAVRAGTLSDTLGRYFIQPARSGTYTVRMERIGYQTTTHTVSLTDTGAVVLDFSVKVNPLRLRELSVTRGRRCSNSTVAARQTVALWEEARKALSVAAWLERDAGAQFRIRIAEEMITLRREPTQYPALLFDSITDRTSFRSISADDLLESGFVQFRADGSHYYGPDAELLIDPRFVAEHCFSIERRRDRPDLIGLAFEPVPDTRLPDIRGALWIDEQTGALRYIEYEYVNLPIRFRSEYAGGRVNVRQLTNGAFIVDSYRIYMPLLQQEYGGGPVNVQNLHERTGEVLDIALAGVRIELVPRFTVRGVAYDSLRGRALANMRISVPGTPFNAVTDSAGRFTFTEVPRGRYAVAIDDSSFANRPQPRATGFRVDSTDVDVTIGLPSRNGLLAALCPDDPKLHSAGRRLTEFPERLGVLELRLINPDGTAWFTNDFAMELVFFHQPTGLERGGKTITSTYPANGSGVMTVCGVPMGRPIEVNLVRYQERKHVLTAVVPYPGFLRKALMRQ